MGRKVRREVEQTGPTKRPTISVNLSAPGGWGKPTKTPYLELRKLAEREGFEPSMELPPNRISNAAP